MDNVRPPFSFLL
uniref:Uncharacterized protein n=1 Tax=Rhizophora mucronata TaxID=61149 RepID=A0A2P2MZZ1_RHIMU